MSARDHRGDAGRSMTRPDDRLTVGEAAEVLGIRPGTFRVRVHRGRVPAADGQIDGRTPFWYRSTIEALVPPRDDESPPPSGP